MIVYRGYYMLDSACLDLAIAKPNLLINTDLHAAYQLEKRMSVASFNSFSIGGYLIHSVLAMIIYIL